MGIEPTNRGVADLLVDDRRALFQELTDGDWNSCQRYTGPNNTESIGSDRSYSIGICTA